MKKILYLMFAAMVLAMVALSGCSKEEDMSTPADTNAPAKAK